MEEEEEEDEEEEDEEEEDDYIMISFRLHSNYILITS